MVGRNIEQYCDIHFKAKHIIQHKAAQLQYIMVEFFSGYLVGKAFTDITGQSYIQTCIFQDMISQAGGGGFTVRTGYAHYFGIGIPAGKLYL